MFVQKHIAFCFKFRHAIPPAVSRKGAVIDFFIRCGNSVKGRMDGTRCTQRVDQADRDDDGTFNMTAEIRRIILAGHLSRTFHGV